MPETAAVRTAMVTMDELIDQVATQTGIARDNVAAAIGIIVRFLASEAPGEKVSAVVAMLPGAADMIAEGRTSGGGIFGVLNDLAGCGLGFAEIQSLARAFIGEARAVAGAEQVDALVASIPALKQFI